MVHISTIVLDTTMIVSVQTTLTSMRMDIVATRSQEYLLDNLAPWEELAFLSTTYNRVNLVRFQDGVLGVDNEYIK